MYEAHLTTNRFSFVHLYIGISWTFTFTYIPIYIFITATMYKQMCLKRYRTNFGRAIRNRNRACPWLLSSKQYEKYIGFNMTCVFVYVLLGFYANNFQRKIVSCLFCMLYLKRNYQYNSFLTYKKPAKNSKYYGTTILRKVDICYFFNNFDIYILNIQIIFSFSYVIYT